MLAPELTAIVVEGSDPGKVGRLGVGEGPKFGHEGALGAMTAIMYAGCGRLIGL